MTSRIVIIALLLISAVAMAQDGQWVWQNGKWARLGVMPQPAATGAATGPTSNPATSPATGPATGATTQSVIARAQLDNALAVLKASGISDRPEYIRKYLADLAPTADQARRADELIRQLGSDDWRTREQASRDLMKLPVLPVDALRKAALSDDEEVQTRAKEILQKCEGKQPRILAAIYEVLAISKPDGFVQPIIQTLPYCSQDEYLLRQATEALSAVSKPDDAPVIHKLLGGKDPTVRRAGVNVLASVMGKAAEDDILKMLQDADEKVQLDTALAIANMGNRKSLAALLKLMDSPDVAVRSGGFQALGALTGKDLPFTPYDGEQARAKPLAAWKDFLDKDGETIKLRLPFHLGDEDSFLFGNTLIATGYGNLVYELDPTGREVWRYTAAKGVWGAQKLRNGNYLLGCYSDDKAIEVTPNGTVVWEVRGGNPERASQLPNGNYLVAFCTGRVVRELDAQKKVVWEFKTNGYCCDARRLPNGNTLVSCNSGVAVQEVTPDGKVVWEVKTGDAYSAERLPNGNTLIAFYSRGVVEELTPDMKAVWSYKIPQPCYVHRLASGNTLITANAKAVEVTPDGKEVWTRDGFIGGMVLK